MSFLVQFESVVIDVERIIVADMQPDRVNLILDGCPDIVTIEGEESKALKEYLSIRKA